MKKQKTFKRGAVVKVRRGRKIVRMTVLGRWAPGEGDGYAMTDGVDYIDVPAKNIIR